MKPGIADTLKSRWFAILVHIGLWVLLIFALIGFSGSTPDFRDTDSLSSIPQTPIPVAGLEQLSSPGTSPKSGHDTNSLNPFFTRHFIPQQAPAPPAPTTRKFDVTYQGFYQAEAGLRQAMVKLGDAFLVTPVGSRMLSNLFVADATHQFLTLTNSAAQTNVLPLNTKKQIEVPIQ
jgi:hypothetical protein